MIMMMMIVIIIVMIIIMMIIMIEIIETNPISYLLNLLIKVSLRQIVHFNKLANIRYVHIENREVK